MSAGRGPKDRPMLSASHDGSHFGKSPSPRPGGGRPGPATFSNSFHGGEGFPGSHSYGLLPKHHRQGMPVPVDLTQSTDLRINPEFLADQHRRFQANAAIVSMQQAVAHASHHQPAHPVEHHRVLTTDRPEHPQRPPDNRLHPAHMFMDRSSEASTSGSDKRMIHPPMDPSMGAPLPKKGRYQENNRHGTASGSVSMQWSQPLRIDTNMDASKLKMEPPGGYHPETEAISPTLPTESHDSKSDIVHSINEVDREIGLIENQIQQLQKKQSKLEAEAARPKADLLDDECSESKTLSIAQIVYRENRKLAQQSHSSLYKFGEPTDMPLFHQPCDSPIFQENAKKFASFRSVLQTYFKKKVMERTRMENYLATTYEKLVTSWLKKADAKTLKKNIKDLKTREYFEKVFPEIKKSREDKERITSRVGARGVGGGYARTEAEMEQIMDSINEQEEEDKKMKAYAVIPPMLNQNQRKLKFINNNGLISEPMALYKQRKQATSWSSEEKELFKEKYLERPKQFGQISDLLEKKTLNDCVLYYYMSKKTENYKQLLKKQVKKQPRRPPIKQLRNSNEGQISAHHESTSSRDNAGNNVKSCGEEEIVRVTDSKHNVCAVCGVKLETYTVSHAVTAANCSQFGLDEKNYQQDWRVCAPCAKIRRRRNTICPIPSCTTPRRRIRHLPVDWSQIPSHTKETIRQELDLQEEVNRCCSTCYDKISDLLGGTENDRISNPHEEFVTKWSEDNISSLKQGIMLHGKAWQEVANKVSNKSEEQCKLYFYRNKKKLGLSAIYHEFKKKKSEELGYDLDSSDDSADEYDDDNLEDNDMSSDNETSTNTASLPPKPPLPSQTGQVMKMDISDSPSNPKPSSMPLTQDRKLVNGEVFLGSSSVHGDSPASGSGGGMKTEVKLEKKEVKQEKTDYDSSATASADEGPSLTEVSGPAKPVRMMPPGAGALLSHISPPVNQAPYHHHQHQQQQGGMMTQQGLNSQMNDPSASSYNKALKFLEQAPAMMKDPDGMRAYGGAMQDLSQSQPQPPASAPQNASNTSTSVKDLIDQAIDEALTTKATPEANNTVSQKQSVISHSPHNTLPTHHSSASAAYPPRKPHQPKDMRLEAHPSLLQYVPPTSGITSPFHRSVTPNRNSSALLGKDDSTARSRAPLPPYKGDPRDFIQVTKDLHQQQQQQHLHPGMSQYGGVGRGGEGGQIRAPPPAHSHHNISSEQRTHANRESKSPARAFNEVMFAMYDKKPSHSPNRLSPRPSRGQSGHPPPLISSGGSQYPSPHNIKKEISHAGGSILHGTSAQQPNRYEGGSISHGTPRGNQDGKSALSINAGRDDKPARSPRTPSQQHSEHSPASVRGQSHTPQQQQQYEVLIEQQRQMMLFRHMQSEAIKSQSMSGLAPGMPFSQMPFPPMSSYEPFQTKSVLQNDFLTAKQMAEGVNLSTYTAAVAAQQQQMEKDKAAQAMLAAGGKVSPAPPTKEQLLTAAGLAPGMMDPATMQMLFLQQHQQRLLGAAGPRMMSADAQRLLTAAAVSSAHTTSTSPMPKESGSDAAARSWASSHMMPGNHSNHQSSRADPPRQQRPSIMAGMIPKTVESLSRAPDTSRGSLSPSPHSKLSSAGGDHRTRYQKEIEEVRLRTNSERTRTDSERTLTDNESSNHTFPGQAGNRMDYYGVQRSTSIGSRSDIAHSNRMEPSNLSLKPHQQSVPSIKASLDRVKAEEAAASMRLDPSGKHLGNSDSRIRSMPSDYRPGIPGGNPLMPGGRIPYSREREEAIYMEQERKLMSQMKAESERSGFPMMKQRHEDSGFASKRLAEVSKGFQKDLLLKDASALFSSSFEKDAHERGREARDQEQVVGMTAAKIIDAIITKQINNENDADSNNSNSNSSQHTSVIVTSKNQRAIQHSRSDTDIMSYHKSPSSSVSSAPNSATPPTSMSSSSHAGSAVPPRAGAITLADKINEIITNDYKGNKTDPYDMPMSTSASRPPQTSSPSSMNQRPYKVEDIEPISPPNSNGSHSKTSKYLQHPNNRPLAGSGPKSIRSLLGADTLSNDSNASSKPHSTSGSSEMYTGNTGLTLMDVVKNNIETAIRHDADYENSRGSMSGMNPGKMGPMGGFPMHPSQHSPHMVLPGGGHHQSSRDQLMYHRPTADDHHDDSSSSKKRSLEAMLAPAKRPALSPRQAKSPEEIDLYNHSDRRLPPSPYPSSSAYNRPPISSPSQNLYTNSGYRPPTSSPYIPYTPMPLQHQPANFSMPNSTSKHSPSPQSMNRPSSGGSDRGHPGRPSSRGSDRAGYMGSVPQGGMPPSSRDAYSHVRSPASAPSPYNNNTHSHPSSRSSSADRHESDLVIDEGSNPGTPTDNNSQPSLNDNHKRSNSRNMISSNNNTRHSPLSVNRHSPAMSGHPQSHMPTATDMTTSRMSPGMGAPAQPASNRQSPAQPNRQSPFLSRQSPLNNRSSPLDGTVRSPLANPCDSPTARYNNHINSDLSRHTSLSENNIPASMGQKAVMDAARSLNTLNTSQSRPLLSEQYETLSDDDEL